MIARIYPALLLLLCSSFVAADAADTTGAHQGSVWVDPGWRRTVSRYSVTFDEQGLSTTVFDFEIQALDEKGAEAISQQTFPYNSYFNELSSSDLATLKADGSVIAVDERAMRDQPATADNSSPYFDELRHRIIAYSHVAPGDKVKGRLIYKAKRAEFAGEFAHYWRQPADQPPEVIELTLDGPASKPLHVALRNVEHSEEKSGNRIVHHVRFAQETPKPRQIDADSFDDARRFEVSTFADYAAFAAMLNARNAPMAQPDETLRKLSTEIAGDAADTRLKVERIHNWVARNIRYVGIGFEDGGWTSQPASAVFASRYGDCKAHATILKALLAAQGIEANLLAVNAGAQYTLTEVATPNFDHAIVYVPQLDHYLDPTASLLAFGSLPPSLGGKPTLNIDKGTLARIPVATPEHFALAADTEYTLLGDGTRQARSILSGSGMGALIGRSIAQGLEAVDRQNTAKKLIEQAGLRGISDQQACWPRRTGAHQDAAPDRPSAFAAAVKYWRCNRPAFPLPFAGIPGDQLAHPARGDQFLRKAGADHLHNELQRRDGIWSRARTRRSERHGCAGWPDGAFQRSFPAEPRYCGLPRGIRRCDQDRLGQVQRIQIRADRPDAEIAAQCQGRQR